MCCCCMYVFTECVELSYICSFVTHQTLNKLTLFQHNFFCVFNLVVFRNVHESLWKMCKWLSVFLWVHECMALTKRHLEKEDLYFCIVALRSIDCYFRHLSAEMRLLYLHYLGCLCVYRAPNNGGKEDAADVCTFISTRVLWIAQIKALEDTEDEGKHISHSFYIS